MFHAYAICNITNYDEIIKFSHKRIEKLFNNGDNVTFILTDNIKTQYQYWSNLIERINASHSNNASTASIHIHNLIKLGDLLELIHREYVLFAPNPPSMESYEQPLTEEQFKWAMERSRHHLPFVMTSWGHESWGFLSGRKHFNHKIHILPLSMINHMILVAIGTRTTRWLNMSNHLRLHHVNYKNVRTFLDSDDVRAHGCSDEILIID